MIALRFRFRRDSLFGILGHILTISEQNDVLGNHFRAEDLRPLRSVPTARLQVPFQVEGFPLLHRRGNELRKSAPRDDVVVLGEALLLSRDIAPDAIRRESKRRDRLAAGRFLEFRIAGDIAEEGDSVHGLHGMHLENSSS